MCVRQRARSRGEVERFVPLSATSVISDCLDSPLNSNSLNKGAHVSKEGNDINLASDELERFAPSVDQSNHMKEMRSNHTRRCFFA